MKIRIKTYNGELPSYLTMGKFYRVSGRAAEQLIIYDDFNNRAYIDIGDYCYHLNGGSWEIVNE